MSSKLDELKKLRDKLEIRVKGIENYSVGAPTVMICNHNCLMDIFYAPSVLPEEIVSLISPRLIYKIYGNRKEIVENYLHAMPIEAHGGSTYVQLCLRTSIDLLKSGISVCIFPEGAYVEDNSKIYRGRTGGARILYQAKEEGMDVRFQPVAINIENKILDLDSYTPGLDNVTVSILPPIDYTAEYQQYVNTASWESKNKALHAIMDRGMGDIASFLGKNYSSEYISLFPKGNVIFEDGTVIPTLEAQNIEWTSLYEKQLEKRFHKIKHLIKK